MCCAGVVGWRTVVLGEVRLGKRRRADISPSTGGIDGPGMTHRSPFPGLLGASPPGVPAVRNVVMHGGVHAAPLLPSPLLPRRLDYTATIPLAPVWTHAVAPTCPTRCAPVLAHRSDACPAQPSCSTVGSAAASPVSVPPQSASDAHDPTPPHDGEDKGVAVGGTPSSASGKIVRVSVRDGCRRRLYALCNAMAGVGDHRGPVSDVVDRLLHWSLPAIRAEFGVGVAAAISSTLPSRVCRPDFRLHYVPGDSGADGADGGDEGSWSGAFGGSQDGSQSSFPPSCRASQRSKRGRGRPRSAGRSSSAHSRPQTWSDYWEDVDQCGPGPEREFVEEDMTLWTGSKAPDVVFIELVKLLQLLALFHLYCPWHSGACRVHVESISYPALLCRLILVCGRKCKWTWHTAIVPTNVYRSRLQEQLYHATVTTGLPYTLIDTFCVALGLCSVHKPTFYKFMRTESGESLGWNDKVVRQALRCCKLAIDTVMRRVELVTLMVDGRYDSARGAQHCTVTAIEYETRLVVGVHTLRPKTEGKASNALKVPAVVRLLRGLMDHGLKIWCVVSDDCASLGPKLRAMNIEWQKDCHHKIKNIRKHFWSMLQLKEAKKVSNPHECVSESQFMQFMKKELVEALRARFGPGVLTSQEDRLKKSDFVSVVMQKMYPYGSRANDQRLTFDPDDVTEFHAHEVGMWFLRACQLCKEEGGDADSLHHDIMLIVDHWAGDHSRCVGGREVLCEKAGGPARLPLCSCSDRVYELILHCRAHRSRTGTLPASSRRIMQDFVAERFSRSGRVRQPYLSRAPTTGQGYARHHLPPSTGAVTIP
ncbi:hypothetical protein CBR_g40729 [Chara braunii]|uniref:Uncharacterized protein n=1 Tax=Chara braunii TaxID=69332 RepID=A0A388LUC2_CHABU|nr:hypothetical protein CBR_g40729 [Chara braunii]|eukprot:GBG85917.1 hypothetical protein CBR_g40729 [Chara braunii]